MQILKYRSGRLARTIAVAAMFVCSVAPLLAQQKAIAPGEWTGSLTLRYAPGKSAGASVPGANVPGASVPGANVPGYADIVSTVRLRLLPAGEGGLLDLPKQSLFGYPLDSVSWNERKLSFSLGALGPGEDLSFEGFFSAAVGERGTVLGTASSTSWKGTFTLAPAARAADRREAAVRIPTDSGELPGTLARPIGAGEGTPYVLLVAGAGPTDRDGNNFNVPGRTDSLKLLALALADRGIGSLRYDKRGSGESYLLEKAGNPSSLDRHALDVGYAYRFLSSLAGGGRIVVVAMNEGAWAAARALRDPGPDTAAVDGLAVIAASGVPPRETLLASLSVLDQAEKNEAESIMQAIDTGLDYVKPAGRLADFFDPARREWLRSWLSFRPAEEIAGVDAPVLYVYAGMDLQVGREEFSRLLDERPGAAAIVIPDMNYVLKSVKSEEENYASFNDNGFPVSDTLVSLLAAFVKAKPLPPGVERFSR